MQRYVRLLITYTYHIQPYLEVSVAPNSGTHPGILPSTSSFYTSCGYNNYYRFYCTKQAAILLPKSTSPRRFHPFSKRATKKWRRVTQSPRTGQLKMARGGRRCRPSVAQLDPMRRRYVFVGRLLCVPVGGSADISRFILIFF